jgi:hypothetical protein
MNKPHKHFKIPVYVLALLLVCAAQAAGAVTVYVNDTGNDQGTTVDIPIMVPSTSNIGATDISLTYDPGVISATGVVVNGTLIAATDLIANHTATSGIVNISVASLYGINGTGSIATIQFHVDGSSGETCPLTVSRAEAYDLDAPIYDDGNCTGYAELDVTVDSATFTVTAGGLPQTGNMDGIGEVDFDDALYLARYTIFGEATYPLHADGNVDSINGVDFDDALYLARYTIFGETSYPLYP